MSVPLRLRAQHRRQRIRHRVPGEGLFAGQLGYQGGTHGEQRYQVRLAYMATLTASHESNGVL